MGRRPRRAWLGVAMALAGALAGAQAATGEASGATPARSLHAASAIVIDASSGDVLFRRNAGRRRAIASTTKLMTALVVLSRDDRRQVFAAPPYSAAPAESQIDLRAGERMTVRDLLTALLLESANDAAEDLAVNTSGSVRAFVREMNVRAARLGLRDTHYANPIGLDEPGNFSTAADLALLARRLMANRSFAAIVRRPRARLRSGDHSRVVHNRNLLVGRYPFVTGVKTGHTVQAGYVLVGSASARGARVITVVLGEPSEAARDADTVFLLRFGLSRFRRVQALRAGATLARVPIAHHDRARARLIVTRGVRLTVRRGERPAIRIEAPDEVSGPLPPGRRVGLASVVYRGRAVATVPLVTARRVPGAPALRRLVDELGGPVPATVALLAVGAGGTLLALRRRAVRRRRERAAAGR